MSALLGRIPSAVGYQPTLATDLGGLQERITTTDKGSITSVQVHTHFAHLHGLFIHTRKHEDYYSSYLFPVCIQQPISYLIRSSWVTVMYLVKIQAVANWQQSTITCANHILLQPVATEQQENSNQVNLSGRNRSSVLTPLVPKTNPHLFECRQFMCQQMIWQIPHLQPRLPTWTPPPCSPAPLLSWASTPLSTPWTPPPECWTPESLAKNIMIQLVTCKKSSR